MVTVRVNFPDGMPAIGYIDDQGLATCAPLVAAIHEVTSPVIKAHGRRPMPCVPVDLTDREAIFGVTTSYDTEDDTKPYNVAVVFETLVIKDMSSDEALRFGRTLARRCAAMETVAAMARHLMSLGDSVEVACAKTVDVYAQLGPYDDAAIEPLVVNAALGEQGGQPVAMATGRGEGIDPFVVSVDRLRNLAAMVVEAAHAAEMDSVLFRHLAFRSQLPKDKARLIIDGVCEHRRWEATCE